ncbi:MAG TPA: polysaccharide biosynthesis/export family protein [Caulobacteraceae bacterium]|nr:polysaccharide biosynthesis/export family protein [Caulobacteraceae bacterium]
MSRWLLALSLTMAFCGAAQAQSAASLKPASVDAATSAAVAAPRAPPGQFAYRLGSGDKLRIIVFGEKSLSGEFLVPGDSGAIGFPLIGDVQAAGLTVSQLADELESKLRDGFLKDPRVSVEVLNYRPYYILGEVVKPGEYPYSDGLTVLNAVATASGFTYRADTRKVYIRHANARHEVESKLASTTPVEPGDTIRIGERFF